MFTDSNGGEKKDSVLERSLNVEGVEYWTEYWKAKTINVVVTAKASKRFLLLQTGQRSRCRQWIQNLCLFWVEFKDVDEEDEPETGMDPKEESFEGTTLADVMTKDFFVSQAALVSCKLFD